MDKETLVAILDNLLKTDPLKYQQILNTTNDVREAKQVNKLLRFEKTRKEQLEFIYSEFDINIALCGNQWGKTTSMMFLLAETATGNNPNARHQPDPSRDMMVWVIAESWEVITNTVQKDLFTFLDQKYICERTRPGVFTTALKIKAPNGGITSVQFKTISESKKEESQGFEGNRVHYVFVDEGIRPELFQDILIRIGSCDGQFFQAFTRLAKNYHMAYHLIDLEKGKGDFAHLIAAGKVKIIRGSTLDNIFLSKKQLENMQAAAGMDITTGKIVNEHLYKARILGELDRLAGCVFNFREEVDGQPYNTISFTEMAGIWATENGRWDLLHDYAQATYASWVLIWTSLKTGTTYFIDEVYAKNMSLQESAERCNQMLNRWEAYNKVKICFADRQITNQGIKENRVDVDVTILSQYLSKSMPNGEPCFHPHMRWHCRQSDKNNIEHTVTLMQELLEEENPLTPGKSYLRYTCKADHCQREIKSLRWAITDSTSKSDKSSMYIGEDHTIDPTRYFINNKVNKAIWKNRFKIFNDSRDQFKENELAYLAGANANPLFTNLGL